MLCATLIYELVGMAISKVALQKAGEIHKEEKARVEAEQPIGAH